MLFSSPILDMVLVSNNHERGQHPGDTLLYNPYTYLPPSRFGGLKRLCLFWFGIGYGFRGNYGCVHVRMYLSFSVLNE